MKFNIRTKIFLAFLLVISVGVISIVINFTLLNSLSQQTHHIIDIMDPAENAAFDLRNSFNVDIRAIEAYGNGYASLDETEKIVHEAEAKIEIDIKIIESTDLENPERIQSLKDILEKDEIADEKVFELKKNAENKSVQEMSSELHQALISFNLISNDVKKEIDIIIDDFKEHKMEDVAEYENSIHQSRLYITAAFTISILLSILLAFIISLALSGSIKKIRDSALNLSQGDLSQRVSISSKDEVEDLANAFNQMADKLQQSTVHLEKIVAERTRELSEEQAKLTASIRSLSLGFIMADNSNNIIMTNPAVEKIFGQSKLTLDWLNKQFGRKFDLLENCRKCLEDQKVIDVKDVEYDSRFLRIFLAPVVMIRDHEEVIGTVILIEDITEAKLLQRSRDEFFSIASHELRTPLTSIRGNTSMILDYFSAQLKDPQMKEMIDDVHESSIRLIEIVNDFLDTSRLELGKMQFKKDILDLTALIPDVIKEYQVTSSRKRLYINFDNTQKIPPVAADKDRFKQVLINLIGNGLKFTEKGGVIVSLEKAGKLIKVKVADSGIGIPEDNQKLLFRKFQQAESNIMTRDATKGTGLGLYISKMMVEGMGGKIVLESSVVGKGTTFSFTLPLATEVDVAAAKTASAKILADFHAGPAMNTNKATTRKTGGV